jgi:hypothetical protein
MVAFGSDNVSIKVDGEELQSNYSWAVRRTCGRLTAKTREPAPRDAYLEDSTLADLFAFLPESNKVRRGVITDADFGDIIVWPVEADEEQNNKTNIVISSQ